jgi:transposase
MKIKVKPVLALPEGLDVIGIEILDEVLTITAVSTQVHPCCPLCGAPALRVHSRSTRQITDLPCSGQQVCLLVQVRKCFCQVPSCARKIFLERLTPFVEPWARVTRRVYQIVQILGLATGGRLGIRVTDRLGIETSRHTILRRIMALPTESVGNVLQIGIDDFSFRRGRKFGTIIVDLQTHKVLDVLPDRTADTSAAWIAAHPEIELVSRDRGGDYAAAGRYAAPQAIQTADRFHLLKNLGEALEGVLARHLAAHRKRQTETAKASPILALQAQESSNTLPKKAVLSQAKREERLAQYEQVVALRQLGFSQTAIAGQVGIGHATVSRWLNNGTFPEQQPRPRSASVDPHLPQLIEQWESGCYTIAELHRELVADGYSHQYNSVYRRLTRSLPEGPKNRCTRSLLEGPKNQETSDQLLHPPVLARQAMFLFLRRPAELSAEEQETLLLLRSLHPETDQAYALVQQFAQMLRTLTGERLDDWLCHVKDSRIRELQGFVAGVIRDKAAVVAGLTLAQNNGLVEGKVNKLKLIKRMGYGRAGFPLLRQRVLHAL